MTLRTHLTALALLAAAGLSASALAQHGQPEHASTPSTPATPPTPPTPSTPPTSPTPSEKETAPTSIPTPRARESAAPRKGGSTIDSRAEPRSARAKAEADTPMTADAALKALQDGNQRWVADKDQNGNTEPSRRAALADKGQKPFVTILTCSDSRLPVERIFDVGVGEVFVVRVAGNVAGGSESGTIEYGVEHLKTPLLVVMGHTKCGAVAAAASGAELHGALGELVGHIAPAVERVKRSNPGMDDKQVAPLAVRENVWQSISDLFRHSPAVREAIGKGELKVVGAVCDISTGRVDWMGEHPWQSELVDAFNSRAGRTNTAASAEKDDK